MIYLPNVYMLLNYINDKLKIAGSREKSAGPGEKPNDSSEKTVSHYY